MAHFGLIHGINTLGQKNVDRLAAPLEDMGHRVTEIALTKRRWWSALWQDAEEDAQIVVSNRDVTENTILVAHSYGVPVAYASNELMPFREIICINGAAHRDLMFRKSGIYCVYSEDDWILRFGAAIPDMFFKRGHPFGLMGYHGSLDPRAHNIRTTGGHSAAFKEHILRTVDMCHRIANGTYTTPNRRKSDAQ